MTDEKKTDGRVNNGGARAGAGRKKNSLSKLLLERQDKILSRQGGKTPLDDLMRIATHWRKQLDEITALPEAQQDQARLKEVLRELLSVSKESAPYVHPRLAAVAQADVTAKVGVIRAPTVAASAAEWLAQAGRASAGGVNDAPQWLGQVPASKPRPPSENN
jgi:hypothetical protein